MTIDAVYRLPELLLPACPALGFGVLLVVHALALRGWDHRKSMLFAYLVAELAKLSVGALVAAVTVKVHEVDSIEDDVIMAVAFVDMGSDHILIFPLCRLSP